MIDVHLDHAIWLVWIAVGTVAARKEHVEIVSDKGYVCDSNCIS